MIGRRRLFPPGSRRRAHLAPESAGERGFGLIAHIKGDLRHRAPVLAQPVRGKLHPPAGEILHRRLAEQGGEVATLAGVDLSPLQSPQALALMLLLAKYPEMLSAAAQDFAPHDVTFYLRELAAAYHSYYDAERILVDDEAVRRARLALVAATAQVLHNGLAVLGVSAPQKM